MGGLVGLDQVGHQMAWTGSMRASQVQSDAMHRLSKHVRRTREAAETGQLASESLAAALDAAVPRGRRRVIEAH